MQHSVGPAHGIWAVEVDGAPLLDAETGEAVIVDGYNATLRYNESFTLDVVTPGVHTLTLVNTGERHPSSSGTSNGCTSVRSITPEASRESGGDHGDDCGGGSLRVWSLP